MEKVLLRLFGMRDEVWARHVNPWSVWTRMPIIALIVLAIWARVWLGWWCLVPLGLIAFWTWLKPRLMPHVGNAIALVGLVVLAYGLVELVAWAAVLGTIVTIGGKLYFLHEMTRIFAAHKDEDPVWAGWLY